MPCTLFLSALVWFSAVAKGSEIPLIEPNETYRFTSQKYHHVRIYLEQQTLIHIKVTQVNSDIAFSLLRGNRQKVAEVDSPTGKYGDEALFLQVPESRTYGLRVEAFDPKPFTYEISVRILPRTEYYLEATRAHALSMAANRATTVAEQLDYHRQALAIWEKFPNQMEIALCYYRIGALHLKIGDYPSAASAFRKSISAYENNLPGQAFLWSNLASTLQASGALEQAASAYDNALFCWKELGDLQEAQISLLGLVRILDRMGLSRTALARLTPLEALLRDKGDAPNRQKVLNAMAWSQYLIGEKEEALHTYAASRAIRPHPLIDSRSGAILHDLGLIEEALAVFDVAQQGWLAMGRKSDALKTRKRLAELWIETGNLDAAHATACASLQDNERPENLAVAHHQLARIALIDGHLSQALFHMDACLDATWRMVNGARMLRTRQAIAARRYHYLDDYLSLLMRNHEPEKALTILEKNRLIGWTQPTKDRQLSKIDLNHLKELDELAAMVAKAMRLQMWQGQNAMESRVAEAMARYTNLESSLHRKRIPKLEQMQPLPLSQLRAQLGENTAALVYALGEEQSYLWYVHHHGLETYTLPPRSTLRPLLERFRQQIQARSAARKSVWLKQARQLGELILTPLAHMPAKQGYVVVGDGDLQAIPFEALIPPGKDEVLLADARVSYLPSLSHLALIRQREMERSLRKGILFFYDPLYDHDERLGRDDPLSAYRRLPQTAVEVAGIKKTLARTPMTEFSGSEANFAQFMEEADKDYQVIHMATHAIANPVHGEHSGLILATLDAQGFPLRGALPAYQLAALDLPCEMVILSACATGVGQLSPGQPTNSVANSFLAAGAARVVASLWPVEDGFTARFMTRFYQRLSTPGMSPADALRQTQLSFMNARRVTPYHWASFVLIGDWKPFHLR